MFFGGVDERAVVAGGISAGEKLFWIRSAFFKSGLPSSVLSMPSGVRTEPDLPPRERDSPVNKVFIQFFLQPAFLTVLVEANNSVNPRFRLAVPKIQFNDLCQPRSRRAGANGKLLKRKIILWP